MYAAFEIFLLGHAILSNNSPLFLKAAIDGLFALSLVYAIVSLHMKARKPEGSAPKQPEGSMPKKPKGSKLPSTLTLAEREEFTRKFVQLTLGGARNAQAEIDVREICMRAQFDLDRATALYLERYCDDEEDEEDKDTDCGFW